MNKPKGKNGIYFRNDGKNFGFYYYDADKDKFVWLSKEGGISDFDWDDFVSSDKFKNSDEMVFVCKTIEKFVKIMSKPSKPPVWQEYVEKNIGS